MAEYTIYTRVYSERSAGKLSSGKGSTGNALTHAELLDEFRNHAKKQSKEPTALISVSSRIVDTVQRAFQEYYGYGQSPEDIWIAFIKVPVTVQLHAAQHLAEECGLPAPGLRRYEYIFEWIIPGEYVLHQVSLQTLMDRGLDWDKYLFMDDDDDQVASTPELRKRITMDLLSQQAWRDPRGVGIFLALFARNFGARAPLDWVAHQLFDDCVTTEVLDDYIVLVKYGYGSSTIVDLDFFFELDDGIETGLCEWWLTDDEFQLNWSEFDEWRADEEHEIIQDEINFWETWYYPDYEGVAAEPSERERLLRNKAWDNLSAKHEKILSAIEAEAVKIGL